MNPAVARSVLEELKSRGIGYTVTDRELRVVDVYGDPQLFRECDSALIGQSLPACVPELIGLEHELHAILAGESSRLQIDLVNRETVDGEIVYLNVTDLPLRDAQGAIQGLIHLVEDMTEVARVQQQLTQQRNELLLLRPKLEKANLELKVANAELQKEGAFKSSFFDLAAHKLSAPLTSILGFLELLLDGSFGPLNEEQTEYLNIVQESAKSLFRIVTSLLDLFKIESGKLELILVSADLAELVHEAVSGLRPQLDEKSQQLALSIAPDLPAVMCDTDRMVETIANLLRSTIKNTPAHQSVGIDVFPIRNRQYVQISVPNSEPASLPDFSIAGTLIPGDLEAEAGLTVAHILVELQGGKLWLDRMPGRRSVVNVTVPVAAN